MTKHRKRTKKNLKPYLTAAVILVALAGVGWAIASQQNDKPNTSQNSVPADDAEHDALTVDGPGDGFSQSELEKQPAEHTTFSKLPADLQKVALAKIVELVPSCVKDGHLVNFDGNADDPPADYAPVGAAIIGIGCDSGSPALFARTKQIDGPWQFLEKTQQPFSCKIVFEHPVPKQLLELVSQPAQCMQDGKPISYEQGSAIYYY